jgi:hypothetical protein
MTDKAHATLHALAMSDALDLAGGRWAKLTRPHVSGEEPIVRYPDQPQGSPWRGDSVPNEEPLGYQIDDQPTIGEPHEIASSLRATSSGRADDVEGSATASVTPASVGGSGATKSWRRM